MKLTDKITITNEDNMELMARYPDDYFDLAIVDPPYRDSNQPTKDMRKNGSMKSLKGRPTKDYFGELLRVSKNQIIWGANNFELPQFKGFFVWDKGIPFDFTMSMCEIASISEGLGTISKIWKYRIAGAEKRIHPTQKPVQLYSKILDTYAKEGDKILDTHLGSGSIAIACHNRKFELTACELDQDYYKASIKRIQDHISQLTIF
jgi:site-specific DNA-methyltransferase (adenine-specific)